MSEYDSIVFKSPEWLPVALGVSALVILVSLWGYGRARLPMHLKVIGIFARLCHRDGKCRYRVETPRFFGYLQRELAPWPELHSLRDWLGDLSAG